MTTLPVPDGTADTVNYTQNTACDTLLQFTSPDHGADQPEPHRDGQEDLQEQMYQTLQVPSDTAQAAHYTLHTAHSQYAWPRAH